MSDDPLKLIERLNARLSRERKKREGLERVAEEKTQQLYFEKQKLDVINKIIRATASVGDFDKAYHAAAQVLMDTRICDSTTLVELDETFTKASIRGLHNIDDSVNSLFGYDSFDWRELWSQLDYQPQCDIELKDNGYSNFHLIRRLNKELRTLFVVSFSSKLKRSHFDHDIFSHLVSQLKLAFEKQRSSDIIHQISSYDRVTKLVSPDLFLANLDKLIVQNLNKDLSFSIVTFDVAQMSLINSRYSMDFGNQVLKRIASELALLLREHDVVTRYTGNRFAFYLFAENIQATTEKVIERVYQRFEQPVHWAGESLKIELHSGFYMNHGEQMKAEQCLQFADVALKQSKEKGNFEPIAFEQRMLDSAFNRHKLEQQLRNALGEQQFELYYQPITDLTSGMVTHAEALMRWHDPETDSMINPAEFIPLLEDTDLILPVGRWLIRQALIDLKSWQDKGISIKQISVNLSARQFFDESLEDYIATTLDELSMLPQHLMLEVTESLYLEANDRVEIFFDRLTKMGVSFALDDFGTGYSSLSYLYRYPISTLKVDRSFVSNLEAGSKHIQLLKSIVALSKSLELKTIAEGIENKDAELHLKELGVEYGQGFYYSRAVPYDLMSEYLLSHQSNSLSA